jgi:hypothetical protein
MNYASLSIPAKQSHPLTKKARSRNQSVDPVPAR